MIKSQYFCDKCEHEVKEEKELVSIHVPMVEYYGMEIQDVCQECHKKYMEIWHKRMNEFVEEWKSVR